MCPTECCGWLIRGEPPGCARTHTGWMPVTVQTTVMQAVSTTTQGCHLGTRALRRRRGCVTRAAASAAGASEGAGGSGGSQLSPVALVKDVAVEETPKRFIVGGEEEEPGETVRFMRLETLVQLRRLYRVIAFAERMLDKGRQTPSTAASTGEPAAANPVAEATQSLQTCAMVWDAVDRTGMEDWEVRSRPFACTWGGFPPLPWRKEHASTDPKSSLFVCLAHRAHGRPPAHAGGGADRPAHLRRAGGAQGAQHVRAAGGLRRAHGGAAAGAHGGGWIQPAVVRAARLVP